MGWGSKRKEPPTAQHTLETLDVEVTEEVTEAVTEAAPARATARERRVVEDDPVAAATIGATLHLKGELTGHEDITIDGSVEGRVEVLEHTLTIGPSASIQASIRGRCVVIEGKVVGDVTAEDKVEITATGSLVGDIRAARVVLAEDARFKGSIDMGWSESAPERTERAERPAPRPPVREERVKEERVKEERPAPKPASSSRSGLSALDWDTPAPPPPTQFGSNQKDE